MKKKWLALFCLLMMLLAPLTGLNRIEAEYTLARALTATGGACSLDTMMAIGSATLNAANMDGAAGFADAPSLDEILAALKAAGMRRGFHASTRACEAAAALVSGTRTLPRGINAFAKSPPEAEYQRVGAWYFFSRAR